MASPAVCGGSAAGGQRGKGGRIPGRAQCRTAASGQWPALPRAADRLPVASAAKGEGFRVVLNAERLHLGDGQPCRVRRIGCRWPARQRGKDSGSCSMPNGCTDHRGNDRASKLLPAHLLAKQVNGSSNNLEGTWLSLTAGQSKGLWMQRCLF